MSLKPPRKHTHMNMHVGPDGNIPTQGTHRCPHIHNHVLMYIHKHTDKLTHIFRHIPGCVHMHAFAQTHTQPCARALADSWRQRDTYTCAHVHIQHIHVNAHKHLCMCIHTCTHRRTHTHPNLWKTIDDDFELLSLTKIKKEKHRLFLENQGKLKIRSVSKSFKKTHNSPRSLLLLIITCTALCQAW